MEAGSLLFVFGWFFFLSSLQKQLTLGKKTYQISPLRPIPSLDVRLFVRREVADVQAVCCNVL